MTLEEWRKKKGLSYVKLAALLSASHATVARRWCLKRGEKGRMIPSEDFMAIIQATTLGDVTPNDFYR